jgi:tetratricopeptide (TPR) repeat protein
VGLFARLTRYIDDRLLLSEEARAHVEAARKLLDEGDAEAALTEAGLALAIRDDHPQVLSISAEALRRVGETAEAERLFREALKIDSEHAPARVGLARLLRASGQVDEAAEQLRKATPHLVSAGERGLAAEVLAELAECHLALGRPDRAARELRKAISLGANDASLHARLSRLLADDLDEPESARAVARRAVELVTGAEPSPPRGEVLVEVGEAASAAGLTAEAVELFQRAIAAGIDAHLQLGHALLAAGDTLGANEHALRALSADPTAAEPHRLRARAALRINDHAAALSAFEAALASEPRHEDTLRLALDSASRVDLGRAGALAAALLELTPGDPFARAVDARSALARGENERAAPVLDELVGSAPHVADVWLGQAELALSRRDGEAALSALEQLESIAPDRPEADRLAARACRLVATSGADVEPDLFDVLERVHGLLAGRSDLGELGVEVARIREDYDMPLLLTVMGEFNSGKSTFINALVGAPVAPMGVTPTTATINVLKFGPEKKVRVFHRTGTVKELEYDALAGWLKSLSRSAAAEVRQVEILYPAEELVRVNLVDTPGFNSIVPEHEAVARQFIERADAVVWLFDAGQPGKESERAALGGVTSQGKRVLGVLNKADRLDPASLAKVLAHLDQTELTAHVEAVVPLSARGALAAKQGGAVDPAALAASGLPAVQSALEERFYSQARLIKRRGCAARLVAVLEQAIAREARATADLRRDAEALAQIRRGVAPLATELGREAAERVTGALAQVRRDVASEAASEVLEFVRPRRHLLESHAFGPEDRRYLVELIEERLETGLDSIARDIGDLAADRVRRMFEQAGIAPRGDEPAPCIGSARFQAGEEERPGQKSFEEGVRGRNFSTEKFLPRDHDRDLGSAVAFGLSAFLRGLARGGRADRFFDDELPRLDLEREEVSAKIAAWWEGADSAVHDIVERAVSDLVRRLDAMLESEIASLRSALARRRRTGARPLSGFAALAREWVEGRTAV